MLVLTSIVRYKQAMAPKKTNNLLTITMAAEHLGISRQAVALAIKRGKLPSMKIGNVHLIQKDSLDLYKKTAKPGRPRSKG